MRLRLAPACAALLLAACGSTHPPYGGYGGDYRQPPVTPSPGAAPPPHPLARTISYLCEDLTRVSLTEGQPNARATLNSGLELSLARLGGSRYGMAPYEFRVVGSEAQWINQGRVIRCRVG